MEVIGAVSSVVTLAETTSKLAKSLTHLAQRWHNAPEEILALAHATRDLATKFAFVKSTITNSPGTLIDDTPRQGLMELVLKANTTTNELNVLHKRLDSYQTILQKARWAVKDARTVKLALAMIKDIEDGLSMWINFVSLKGHGLTLLRFEETQRILSAGFAEMRQNFAGLAITHPSNLPLTATSRKGSPPIPASSSTTKSDPTAQTAPQTAIVRKFEATSWKASKMLQFWGLDGTVVKSIQGQSTDYDFDLNAHLPLAWLFGSYALRGQLSIRKSSLVSNTFTLRHPSYFTVARVLDRSHPFFEACRSDDVAVVRTMLSSGEGRPTDIDSYGNTCLWYAITNGSMDVVICVLDHGIAVDEAVSSGQLTPLHAAAFWGEIDILRMLLGRGASSDRFDTSGIDVSLYSMLFPHRFRYTHGLKTVASVDLLKVINKHASLDTNALHSLWDATLLHLTASYHSASDIDFLISLGCKVEDQDRDGCTALCHAAVAGNEATYFALLAHGSKTAFLENNLLLAIDARAYFHSANYDPLNGPGDFDPIFKDLLDRRVDLMTSIYVADGWPQEIQGPSIPLQQAVAAYGPETEAWFLGLLQECGLETEEDRRRLQELKMGGHEQHGTVIGEVDEESDCDGGDEDPEHTGSELDRSSAQSEADDAEEDERFWDAEEGE